MYLENELRNLVSVLIKIKNDDLLRFNASNGNMIGDGSLQVQEYVKSAAQLIIEIKEWLNCVILEMIPELAFMEDDGRVDNYICYVRSGLQCMLDLFKGIYVEGIDDTLQYLDNEVSVFFDTILNCTKYRINFMGIPEYLPEHHLKWWTAL